MHKAKYADRSIYGVQVRLQYVLLITLPAANNLSLLKRLNLGLYLNSCQLIVHLTQPAIAVARVWKSPVRHLPGSWPRFPYWEHSQGHCNCIVMEIFSQMFSS